MLLSVSASIFLPLSCSVIHRNSHCKETITLKIIVLTLCASYFIRLIQHLLVCRPPSDVHLYAPQNVLIHIFFFFFFKQSSVCKYESWVLPYFYLNILKRVSNHYMINSGLLLLRSCDIFAFYLMITCTLCFYNLFIWASRNVASSDRLLVI